LRKGLSWVLRSVADFFDVSPLQRAAFCSSQFL
jgi:hypothetical protein